MPSIELVLSRRNIKDGAWLRGISVSKPAERTLSSHQMRVNGLDGKVGVPVDVVVGADVDELPADELIPVEPATGRGRSG